MASLTKNIPNRLKHFCHEMSYHFFLKSSQFYTVNTTRFPSNFTSWSYIYAWRNYMWYFSVTESTIFLHNCVNDIASIGNYTTNALCFWMFLWLKKTASVSITLVHLILLQCSLFILQLASAYDLQKTPPGFRNTKCILELSYLLLTDHFTSLHQNCGTFSLLHFVHLVLWLCLRNNWNLIFSHIDLFFVYICFELLVCILCIITNRCDLDGMAVCKSLLYVCM